MTKKQILDGTVFLLEDYERIGEVMDIWGKQQAIEFACWLNGHGYDCFLHTDDNVKHWNQYGDNSNLTTDQLYELFLKSKEQ